MRGLAVVGLIVAALVGGWYLHSRRDHGPYYEVKVPYPAYDLSQLSTPCEMMNTGAKVDKRDFCRCFTEYVQSHYTVAEYKQGIAEAKRRGQINDINTATAMSDCWKRVGGKVSLWNQH